MDGETFSILKSEDDKRLVFGWASVALTVDGEALEDRQSDMIDPEDLEEAAYDYVLNFRDTGEEHIPSMRKRGKLVESCVLTREKQRAMGIPEGIVPVGWWIGFHIDDDDAWQRVKNGTYQMFSIEGKANREPVEKASKNYDEFPGYNEWLEENLDATKEEQDTAKTYYQKQAPTGCGVLVVHDGKVLTGIRKERASRGQICGPGGHIEARETPREAAVREAREEFGITCENLTSLGVLDSGKRYGSSAIFLCTSFSGTPKTDEKEMTALEWRLPSEIPEGLAFPPFMQSLALLPKKKSVAKSFREAMLERGETVFVAWPDRYDHIEEMNKAGLSRNSLLAYRA